MSILTFAGELEEIGASERGRDKEERTGRETRMMKIKEKINEEEKEENENGPKINDTNDETDNTFTREPVGVGQIKKH